MTKQDAPARTCARCHRHPDVGPGRRGAAANRRGFHLRPVRSGHYWHRPARGPRARRLRARRGARLDHRSRSQTARRQGILRHDRDFNPHRRRHQLRWPRSNQGAVLVGGNQRRCRGSVDGDYHAHGDARRRDGRLRASRALWAMGWLSTATMAVVVAIMFATW